MTNIVRAQIIQCLTSIGAGKFDENTIRSLYIHLRELARPLGDSLTLDIGDFFAHPGRNRGVVKRHVEPTIRDIVNYRRAGESKEPQVTTIPFTRIMGDLDSALGRLNLPPLGPNLGVALTLFAAFQGTSVKVLDGREVRLGFYVLEEQAGVNGCFKQSDDKPAISFPVFVMPNAFHIPNVLPNLFEPGWPLVRVEFDSRNLKLYQTHEFIERDMPQPLRAHPKIPWKTAVNVVPDKGK